MSIRLYIGNLPKSDVERQDLQDVFAEAGETVVAKVIKDRKTGKCRGFGFLTVETDEQADEIIAKYNGVMFQEMEIKLEKALPKTEEDEAPKSTVGRPERVGDRPDRSGDGQKRSGGGKKSGGGGGNRGSKSGSGGGVPQTFTSGDTGFQPDPRWAAQLEALKEQLAEVNP
jgi:RNA recognition motif-containing protein